MTWQSLLDDLSAILRPSDVPLVFVLGAGCSITSGAPSTLEAFRQLDSGLQRLAPHERAFAPGQSAREKRELLAPSFQNFAPGIGYHLLVSLGRTRQVYVINFNWDPGVQLAANALGIDCNSIESKDAAASWDTFRLPDGQPGVRVLHVHGKLDGDPLARTTETCQFPYGVEEVLGKLWTFHKVCLGINLGFELDFFNFLAKFEGGEAGAWYFSRGTSLHEHMPKLERIGASGRASVDPSFDFDVFMVGLAGNLKQSSGGQLPYMRFAATVSAMPATLAQLCLPENPILVRLILHERVAIGADAGKGGTTLGNLVAYLKWLLQAEGRPPKLVVGLSAAKADLGNSGHAVAAGSDGPVVYDDLVQGEVSDDESLLHVAGLVGASNHSSVVLVAPLASLTRLRSAGETGFDVAFDQTFDLREGEAYTPSVLRAFAERLGASAGLLHDISEGLIQHPLECREGRAVVTGSSSQPAARAELEGNAKLRTLTMAARLIELSAREKTLADVARVAQVPLTDVPAEALARYVSSYTFEGKPWFQVVPGMRPLLDVLLREDAADLAKRLQGRDLALVAQLLQWQLFVDMSAGGVGEGLEPEQFRRMTSALLDEQWEVEALERMLAHPAVDSWGATNIAYALVGGWERFEPMRAQALLNTLLNRRDVRGCYAVVEAALFLGTATPRQVWVEAETACWRLLNTDPQGKELCLVVDAFMWRPPPPGWNSILSRYFATMTRSSPHSGALRFFAAFHLPGLQALLPEWEARSEDLDWNESQSRMAAWLVEWHFVHYAFSRAISFRFGRNDKDMLCRALHPGAVDPANPALRRLLTSMRRYTETAGAGFLAGSMQSGSNPWLLQPEGEELMVELVQAAAEDDVLAAAGFAGYETPRKSQRLRALFRTRVRQHTVMDLVARGAELDGQHFSHQQFHFVPDVSGLWMALELHLPNFEREKLGLDAPRAEFLQEVETAAQAMYLEAEADPEKQAALARIVEGLRSHTRVQDLEDAIPARDRKVSLAQHVLEVMLHMEADAAGAE